MVYTFTIHNSETDTFENYKVTNEIKSRIAELRQMESETPRFISRVFLSNILTTTAKITIEYSDYVKARLFTAMFDEWVEGCEESKTIEAIHTMKSFSHLIPQLGILVIFALLAIFTINAMDSKIIDTELSVKFIVVYASFFVITGNIGAMALRSIEMAIDGYLSMSYLNINKGDAKLIKEYSDKNKNSFILAIIGTITTILIGVATRFAYDFLKLLIM